MAALNELAAPVEKQSLFFRFTDRSKGWKLLVEYAQTKVARSLSKQPEADQRPDKQTDGTHACQQPKQHLRDR